MALGLDGTASIYATSGTSATTGTLTCSNANNTIYAVITRNSSGQSVSSIAGGGLTWTLRKKSTASGNGIEMWSAFASGTYSDTVAVTFTGSTTFATVHAFGVAGGATSSQFDTNASVPVSNTADADLVISTDNADDFIDAGYRSGSANPVPGAGWTQILGTTGSGFTMTLYKIVSTTQSSLAIASGSNVTNGGVGDAVKQLVAGSLIKTVNGLALASVKAVNGLAIASVKTINGLA